MRKESITEINKDILRTKRAIIGLGCSFVEGGGAIDENIYKNYQWHLDMSKYPAFIWSLSEIDKKRLYKDFPDLRPTIGEQPNWIKHNINRSFTNVLAKKYFNGDYAAINLGRSGNGNRATIKDLYFYPDILWNEIKEKIVIFCPSGAERFDFIRDSSVSINDHPRWITMWPTEIPNQPFMSNLYAAYKAMIYSEKFEMIELLANVQELILWCKYHNAKLIITSAFSTKYTIENMINAIGTKIDRDNDGQLIQNSTTIENFDDTNLLVNMWPWTNMFYPDGELTFIDLAIKQEFPDNAERPHFYSFLGTGSPAGWVTPCAHPSAKAHDLFAQHLYNYIERIA